MKDKNLNKCLDIEFILIRDNIIRELLDYDKTYTIEKVKKIRKLLKILNKLLGDKE